MAPEDETLYALYHVDTKTGDAIRYPLVCLATSKAAAEAQAQEIRRTQGLVEAHYSGWQTFALPEGTRFADADFLARLPINSGKAARGGR